MQTYTLKVIEQGYIGIVAALIPAAIYTVFNLNTNLVNKFKIVSPAIIIIFSFIFMVIISSRTTINTYEPFWWAYQAILVFALIFIALPIKIHKGSKLVHFSHVLTIFSVLFLWFLGGMALSHDWM